MKVLALFVFTLLLVAFIIWHPFSKPQTPTENAAATSTPAPTYPKLEGLDNGAPPGFVGPSGPPHIIGPSGPPPG